jgi:superfamily II DNA or RNA helicase
MAAHNSKFLHIGGNGRTELVFEEERFILQKTLSFAEQPSKQIIEAFQEECEILSCITHPRLPKVLRYETLNRGLKLVLEVSPGQSLADFQSKHAQAQISDEKGISHIDLQQILRWANELSEPIIFLHGQRPFPLIHRNITPSSIWITEHDQGIMLLDFGLLNSFHLSHEVRKDPNALSLGPFNHPNLISEFWGSRRADIYSFGRALASLLELRTIWKASPVTTQANFTDAETVEKQSDLEQIAERCCSHDKEENYADMAAVIVDLSLVGSERTSPENRVTCGICGTGNRARARFCSTCDELLYSRRDSLDSYSTPGSFMTYEDQSESKLVSSYQQNHFASLSRYRMMELLDEVESDPGFEELLSLPNLPDVAKMQHQKTAVLRALQRMRGRALLADEVGLGKTVEAGIFLKELLLRGLVEKILIVCPSTPLAAQWQSELYEKFGEIALVFGHDIDTSLAWHCSRLITTYDTLRQPFHVEELLRHTYDLVILDEAHFLNDPENLAVLETVKSLQKKYFLMLSATPMHKSLRELYNIVTLLRPGHFADLASFEREFIDSDNEMQAKNIDTLRELLQQIMIRNRRQDITDYVFPKRKAVLNRLVLQPDAIAFYDRFRDLLKAEMANVSNKAVLRHVGGLAERICSSPDAFSVQVNKLRRNWKVRQVLGDGALRRLEEVAVTYPDSMVEPKLQAMLSVLKQHTSKRERSLAFSEFDETARFFHRRLRGTELEAVAFLYDPQSSLAARQTAIKRLEETPGGILFCSGEASEGLNLQFASLMINLDLPWNPMRLEQRIGRVQRIGGKKDIFIYNLVLKGTIEEKIYEICDQRIKMFEAIVGHMEEILGNLREEEDIEVLIRDFYLDRHAITDEGLRLSAEENLNKALSEAEEKSSRRSEETLSHIYGTSHFDPSSAEEDDDY